MGQSAIKTCLDSTMMKDVKLQGGIFMLNLKIVRAIYALLQL